MAHKTRLTITRVETQLANIIESYREKLFFTRLPLFALMLQIVGMGTGGLVASALAARIAQRAPIDAVDAGHQDAVGRLGRQIIKKLKIYAGPEHEHSAQQPQPLELS